MHYTFKYSNSIRYIKGNFFHPHIAYHLKLQRVSFASKYRKESDWSMDTALIKNPKKWMIREECCVHVKCQYMFL